MAFLAVLAVFVRIDVLHLPIVPRKEVRSIPVDLVVLPPKTPNPFLQWEGPGITKRQEPKTFGLRLPSSPVPTKQFSGFEPVFREFVIEGIDDLLAEIRQDYYPHGRLPFEPPPFEIPRRFTDLRITRDPVRQLSITEEYMSLADIDSVGTWRGYAVQTPGDLKALRGFIHIPLLIEDMRLPAGRNFGLADAVSGLSEVANRATKLTVTVDNSIPLDSPDLLKYPVVYLTTLAPVYERPLAVNNFGDYLRAGGFAILDNATPWADSSAAGGSLIELVRNALGNDVKFESIPWDHPLYNCYYTIENPPPEGAERWGSPAEARLRSPDLPPAAYEVPEYTPQKRIRPARLWGISAGERLVAVYCEMGYGHIWREGFRAVTSGTVRWTAVDPPPAFKMGVNLIVYGLIRGGSVAEVRIDYDSRSGEELR